MTITNEKFLPEPLVNAIREDDYDNGGADASVTELLLPPRLAALKRRYKEQIIEDASERVWSLIGRIGHAILAKGAKAHVAHHRLFMNCLGWTISGEVDLLHGTTISDYKFVSSWVVKDGPRPEWEQQLNLYRLLCSANDIVGVTRLEIVAILRDWSKLEALRNRDYPHTNVIVYDMPLWRIEQAETFMEDRIALHKSARVFPDGVECSPEEMWQREDAWAVVKNGNKRATAVLKTARGAEAYKNDIPERDRQKYRIDFRPGERVRCRSYCAVAPFCAQWQAHIADRQSNPEPVEAA